jgi:hypothetical protein
MDTLPSNAPSLLISLSPAARALPLSVARAQAYEAAASLAGWKVNSTDFSSEVTTPMPASGDVQAVVLIGTTASGIADWLESGHGVIADGVWSQDPEAVEAAGRIAVQQRQPLLQGEELLHAPVLAGALTEAADIGQITSFETRALHPFRANTVQELCDVHGPAVLMRALLCMEMLGTSAADIKWDTARILGHDHTHPTRDHSERITVTWRGRVLAATGEQLTRISVVLSTHPGHTVIHDLQMSSATGVVRAELMPSPQLEVNGESIVIPPAGHSPAQLEWFGMIPMLKLMRRAVTQRSQPRSGAHLLAEALRLSAWALAEGDDPFR